MKLISCVGCACVVKESERDCPECGTPLRRADGSIPATAAAVLLGLVVGVSACGTSTPEYGVPATGGGDASGGSGGAGGDGAGGEGAGGNASGTGGGETPVYGVAGSSGAP